MPSEYVPSLNNKSHSSSAAQGTPSRRNSQLTQIHLHVPWYMRKPLKQPTSPLRSRRQFHATPSHQCTRIEHVLISEFLKTLTSPLLLFLMLPLLSFPGAKKQSTANNTKTSSQYNDHDNHHHHEDDVHDGDGHDARHHDDFPSIHTL